MARHTVVTCDVCRRPTEKIVGKLYFTHSIDGVTRNTTWANYSHTADVGICCKDKIFKAIRLRPRMTKAEYAEYRRQRRNGTTLRAASK